MIDELLEELKKLNVKIGEIGRCLFDEVKEAESRNIEKQIETPGFGLIRQKLLHNNETA